MSPDAFLAPRYEAGCRRLDPSLNESDRAQAAKMRGSGREADTAVYRNGVTCVKHELPALTSAAFGGRSGMIQRKTGKARGMKLRLSAALLAAAFALPAAAGAEMAMPTGHVYPIKAQNGSGEYGTFALKPHGNKTTVEVHLLGAPAGISQPAHLHPGTCAKLNPVPKYPLTALVNGISETSIDVPMATLIADHLALNVHKSAPDAAVYVACGNVTP
jgi:hypothetical protein